MSPGGRIKDTDVETVRERTDIVQLISEFVPLKKSGRQFRGACPFHQEKDPSFYVDPAKGLFHCFGCQSSGNAFNFIMKAEGLNFSDAVGRLADRIGYQISYEAASPQETRARSDRDRLYHLNQTAADYYHYLLKESADGRGALEYLAGRGYGREMVDEFHLGYAPPSWNSLGPFLSKKGYSEREVVTAGLARERERGQGSGRGAYDIFRNRVMFPILDMRGRVVAFGGRAMPGAESAEQPKYLNSPETPVYRKGHTLYGFYQTRDRVQEAREAVVVEGYTDLLSLVQAGIRNVVATLGTALTEYHFDLLNRFCDRVYLAYDADRAGREASVRPLAFFSRFRLDVFVVDLPEGEDPASLMEKGGAASFDELKLSAETLPDFAARRIIEGCDTSTPMGRRRAMEECVAVLEKVSGDDMRPVRDDLVRKIGGWLDMPEATVAYFMREASRGRVGPTGGQGKVRAPDMGEKVEREALKVMLHDPNVLLEHQYMDGDYFTDEEHKKIFEMLKDISAVGEEVLHAGYDSEISHMVEGIDDEALRSRVARLLMEPPPEVDPAYADKVFDRLRYMFFKRLKRKKELEISRVDKGLEPVKYDALYDQLLDLDHLIKEQFPYDHS